MSEAKKEQFERETEKEFDERVAQFLDGGQGLHIDYDECIKFIHSRTRLAYEQGVRDTIMDEGIKRYEQAKEDGTLDKHFPMLSLKEQPHEHK